MDVCKDSIKSPLNRDEIINSTYSQNSVNQSPIIQTLINTKDQEKIQNLLTLKAILQLGIIDQSEYDNRKKQLIDKITETSWQVKSHESESKKVRDASFFLPLPQVIPCDPPFSFDDLPLEHAIKHVFEVDDNQNKIWIQYPVMVRICKNPFARGGLRSVYHMMEYEMPISNMCDNKTNISGIALYNDINTNNINTNNINTNNINTNNINTNDINTNNINTNNINTNNINTNNINTNDNNKHENLCIHDPQDVSFNTQKNNSEKNVYLGNINKNLDYSKNSEQDENIIDVHSDTRHIGIQVTAEDNSAFGNRITYVCKENNTKEIDIDAYFRDVEMQNLCNIYADRFNSYNPPRKIHFNKAWLIELIDRPHHPVLAVERFIPGRYMKHNDNCGYVNNEDRNTPQAFSHFTYEVSGHTLLIVDIQGVDDIYTDPQIHTIDDSYFGQGNLGQYGFDQFLASHQCNSICKYLKLSAINPKDVLDNGTLPQETFMRETHIQTLKIENMNVYKDIESYLQYQQEFEKAQKQKHKCRWCCCSHYT